MSPRPPAPTMNYTVDRTVGPPAKLAEAIIFSFDGEKVRVGDVWGNGGEVVEQIVITEDLKGPSDWMERFRIYSNGQVVGEGPAYKATVIMYDFKHPDGEG